MSAAIDPTERLIKPDGLPLAIIWISCILLGLSIVVVSFRIYIRIAKNAFGLDDALVVAGTVVYAATVGLAVYANLVGLGRLEKHLNQWQWAEAMKFYIIWILMYVVALALVKSSVCITIQRIASTKTPLRITIWVLLAITWASFSITFVGTLAYCQPVRTIWTPTLVLSGEGKCAPVRVFVYIGHVATVSTIFTDLALVVVPAILLWNTQMKRQAKLQAFGLLSFASLASIITMIRIPYVNRFEGMTDLQFWVAHTMLYSNIETGIGCIASSVPSLRHYFRRNSGDSSYGPNSRRSYKRSGTDHELHPRRIHDGFRSPTEAGFNLSAVHGRADDKWERLDDGDEQQGVHRDKGYQINISTHPMLTMRDIEIGQAR